MIPTHGSNVLPKCGMTALHGVEEDRFLRPGSLVSLSIKVGEYDMLEPDYGVVVHCWKNFERDTFHCLVAFLGDSFPVDGPVDPYFSTFASTALSEIPSSAVAWPV